MKRVAIILAGGAGKRMGGDVPKQFLSLGGLPLLVHTLLVFQSSPRVDEILLVVPEGRTQDLRQELLEPYRLNKLRALLSGGKERQDSVRNGLSALDAQDSTILIHDGVRPFVTLELIERTVAAAERYGAATPGIPIRETIKRVDAVGEVAGTLPRDGLWLTQTPQVFRKELILAAYRKAEADRFYGTDDASLLERIGIPVRMVPGDADNIKLTTPEDLGRGERIFCCRSQRGK